MFWYLSYWYSLFWSVSPTANNKVLHIILIQQQQTYIKIIYQVQYITIFIVYICVNHTIEYPLYQLSKLLSTRMDSTNANITLSITTKDIFVTSFCIICIKCNQCITPRKKKELTVEAMIRMSILEHCKIKCHKQLSGITNVNDHYKNNELLYNNEFKEMFSHINCDMLYLANKAYIKDIANDNSIVFLIEHYVNQINRYEWQPPKAITDEVNKLNTYHPQKINDIQNKDVIHPMLYHCLHQVHKRHTLTINPSMKVFLQDNGNVVDILKDIKIYLDENEKIIIPLINNDTNNSCTKIQGNRFEIFIKVEGKGDNVWLQILDNMIQLKKQKYKYYTDPMTLSQEIIQYCRFQASKDHRAKDQKHESIIGNFTLIHTYGEVQQQIQHLDSIPPNYQFGLCLTENCPITKYWVVSIDKTIISLHDIKDSILHNINDENFDVLKCEAITSLLDGFGLLFTGVNDQTEGVYEVHNSKGEKQILPSIVLNTGDVTSLPGGILHAGPATRNNRLIIFFTGCPKNQNIESYPGDIQFHEKL
jgi:hypothetical protein